MIHFKLQPYLVNVKAKSVLDMAEHSKTRKNATMENNASQPRQFSRQVQRWPTSDRLTIEDQVFLADSISSLKAFIYCLYISICVGFTGLYFFAAVTQSLQVDSMIFTEQLKETGIEKV